MNISRFFPAIVFAACLSSGCASHQYTSNAESLHTTGINAFTATAALPDGMRLGRPYISALGENCYEITALAGSSSQNQALCEQMGAWRLLPSVYMNAPTAE